MSNEKSLSECECWNIKGYGISGICLHCLDEKVLRLKAKGKETHFCDDKDCSCYYEAKENNAIMFKKLDIIEIFGDKLTK